MDFYFLRMHINARVHAHAHPRAYTLHTHTHFYSHIHTLACIRALDTHKRNFLKLCAPSYLSTNIFVKSICQQKHCSCECGKIGEYSKLIKNKGDVKGNVIDRHGGWGYN